MFTVCFSFITTNYVLSFPSLPSPYYDFYSENNYSILSAGRGSTSEAHRNDLTGVFSNPAFLKLNRAFSISYVGISNAGSLKWASESYFRKDSLGYFIGIEYKLSGKFHTGPMYLYPKNIQHKNIPLIIPNIPKTDEIEEKSSIITFFGGIAFIVLFALISIESEEAWPLEISF